MEIPQQNSNGQDGSPIGLAHYVLKARSYVRADQQELVNTWDDVKALYRRFTGKEFHLGCLEEAWVDDGTTSDVEIYFHSHRLAHEEYAVGVVLTKDGKVISQDNLIAEAVGNTDAELRLFAQWVAARPGLKARVFFEGQYPGLYLECKNGLEPVHEYTRSAVATARNVVAFMKEGRVEITHESLYTLTEEVEDNILMRDRDNLRDPSYTSKQRKLGGYWAAYQASSGEDVVGKTLTELNSSFYDNDVKSARLNPLSRSGTMRPKNQHTRLILIDRDADISGLPEYLLNRYGDDNNYIYCFNSRWVDGELAEISEKVTNPDRRVLNVVSERSTNFRCCSANYAVNPFYYDIKGEEYNDEQMRCVDFKGKVYRLDDEKAPRYRDTGKRLLVHPHAAFKNLGRQLDNLRVKELLYISTNGNRLDKPLTQLAQAKQISFKRVSR